MTADLAGHLIAARLPREHHQSSGRDNRTGRDLEFIREPFRGLEYLIYHVDHANSENGNSTKPRVLSRKLAWRRGSHDQADGKVASSRQVRPEHGRPVLQ
ncbi:hypothetical protein [Nonomuraea soli]|uniref:Uncharacterized protein n=1 Tax=Nonomuraea soli TaxID=1032476 RepID=A0A7W0HQB6_9ACTN|nr:hypothetical protein [Nonomuraea soli]MBA2891476.1 hypothetical protein [Nonomuraea soli]